MSVAQVKERREREKQTIRQTYMQTQVHTRSRQANTHTYTHTQAAQETKALEGRDKHGEGAMAN